MQQGKIKKPFITAIFVIINVAVYLILEILGDTNDAAFMVEKGAIWPPYIMEGQYWRLLTATFMRFMLSPDLEGAYFLIFRCVTVVIMQYRRGRQERFLVLSEDCSGL